MAQGTPVGNSDLEIAPHLFKNDANDEAAPCDQCRQGAAHKAHKQAAKEAAAETREALTPPAVPGERQPEGHEILGTPIVEAAADPADRMLDVLDPFDAYEEGEAELAFEGVDIADLDLASWVARRLARLSKKRAEVDRVASDQIARIQAWRADETKRMGADVAFFEGRLEAFHRQVLAEDPKAVTVRLPDGTDLTSQAGKLTVEAVDLPAFIEWCEMNELTGDLLRYPDPEPQKAEIAKRFKTKAIEGGVGAHPAATEDGETVPGIQIVRKDRTFGVKGPAE